MKKIVCMSYPNISDNTFAIFKNITEITNEYNFMWLVDSEHVNSINKKIDRYFSGQRDVVVKCVPKYSIRGIYSHIFAKYIFNTHGGFDPIPLFKWQKRIHLGHGMPLKNIGALDGKKKIVKMDFTVSSSPLFQDIIARSFLLDNSQVLPLGLPRNDFFFEDNSELKKELNIQKNQKVYIWMPTYRQSDEGDIRLDGEKRQAIAGISIEEYKKIDNQLIKDGKLLYIKLHPMDMLNKQNHKFDFENIKLMKSDEFLKLGCEVNHFLSLADVLITDYSSVYFDFALLNRPIILYTDDQESYKNSRGFTSEKLLDVMKESLTISTPEALIDALAQPVENLPVISKEANNIINQYTLEILEQKKSITGEVIKALGL